MPEATVAVLGTGTMGEPIARNLLKAGFDVRAWNRTRKKAEPLAGAGATVCDRAADAVAGADFVLTLVADGDAVAETMQGGALATMRDGAVWVQTATVGVVAAELLAVTEAAAESVALAEGLGIDPREFLDTMAGSQIDSPYLHIKGEAILERSLEPSFKLRLAEKDSALVLEAAEEADVDLAVARAGHEAFSRAAELGHGDEDMAAVYFAANRAAPR